MLSNNRTPYSAQNTAAWLCSVGLTLSITLTGCGGGGSSSSPEPEPLPITQDTSNAQPSFQDLSDTEDSVTGSSSNEGAAQTDTSLTMSIENGFQFVSEYPLTLVISAVDRFGTPLANKAVSIYTTRLETTEDLETIRFADEKFYQASTDNKGALSVDLMLANHITELNVQISAIGMESSKFFTIVDKVHYINFR